MIVGIETGGTKVVCAVADVDRPADLVRVERFPTTDPDTTIARIAAFVDAAAEEAPVDAIGIASFGPVGADPGVDDFGRVLGTPKAGWAQVDLLGRLRRSGAPAAFVLDVTGAAVGEQRWGAGRGSSSGLAYATVGTGVGVGVVLDGRPVGGGGWPELGHLLVRRHPADRFEGSCPFHGDCLEGLASGPAVQARWGADASSIPDAQRDEAHDVLASYLAQLAYTVVLALGVDRMVLGGGVMLAPGLLEGVRRRLPALAGGYGPRPLVSGDPGALLVPPALGGSSGVVGALTLAADLLR